jgi:antitoxin Phd
VRIKPVANFLPESPHQAKWLSILAKIDKIALMDGKKRAASMSRGIGVYRRRRGSDKLLNTAIATAMYTCTATEAKNEFGQVLDKVMQGTNVVITRHDVPKAVLISMDAFNALSPAPQLRIDALSGEFDAMLARMQSPQVRAAMKSAFHASPKKLGKAAVAAARKRG